MCVCSRHTLFHHANSLNPQGDFLVTQETRMIPHSFILLCFCTNWSEEKIVFCCPSCSIALLHVFLSF